MENFDENDYNDSVIMLTILHCCVLSHRSILSKSIVHRKHTVYIASSVLATRVVHMVHVNGN